MAISNFKDSWQDEDFEDVEKVIKQEANDLSKGIFSQSVQPNADGVSSTIQNLDRDGNPIGLPYRVLQQQSESEGTLVVNLVGNSAISYIRGAKTVSVQFKVSSFLGTQYDATWRAKYSIIKNVSGGNTTEEPIGNYSPISSDENTVHTTPNLIPYLTVSSNSVTDSLVIEVSNASLGKTARRVVNITSVSANVELFDNYDNKNIARISRPNMQFVTTFAAESASLKVKTESVFGGNEKNYTLNNISSDLSAKTITFSGEQEGERRVNAYVDINNGSAQSETFVTEMMVVGSSSASATMVAIDDVRNAVQYEDYTLRFGLYAGNKQSADAKIEILDANGKVTATANMTMTCSTTSQPNRGIAGEYTFSVPSTNFSVKITSGGYSRTLQCTAEGSEINWEVASGAELELNAKGRTNLQADPDVWENNGYRTIFQNVEFDAEGGETTNGWKDNQCLHLTGKGRAIVPISPFYDTTSYNASQRRGGGILATGRTIAFKFRVGNVIDIASKVIDCFDDASNLGFSIYGDSIYARVGRELVQRFDADQTSSTNNRRFAANEEVEVCITVEALYEGATRRNPEVKLFVNGEIAASTNITTSDSLSQNSATPITFGGDGASLDLFYVRVYNKWLSAEEVYKNFVMSKNNQDEMIASFEKNNYQIQSLSGAIEYCKAQSLKTKGNCSIVVTTDLRRGITSTSASDGEKLQQLHLYYFKNGEVDTTRSVKFVATAGGTLRVRVQGTSTAAMPEKNLRYDARGNVYKVLWNPVANDWYEINDTNIANGNVTIVTKLDIVIDSPDNLPCSLLTTKTNYNESTATRNLPNALWVNDAINALAAADPTTYRELLTPPQRANAKVRQTINGVPALQYYYDLDKQTYSFAGKVDIITDKSNQAVFGFTNAADYSIELRSNTSDVCNFKTSDLTRAGQLLSDGQTAGNDDLEYRYPDATTQYGQRFIGQNTAVQRLWDFVYNCSPDHLGYESNNGVVTSHTNLVINGRVPYITDNNTSSGNKTYTVDPQTSKNIFYETKTDWRVSDTIEYRRLKFFAEAHRYMAVMSFVFNGLISHTHLWTDQRAKNQFFTHFNGDTDSESGNDILRLLPYDIDTSWRGDNDSRLRYDYTRTYNDEGIYDDDRSTLWVLMDACFQTEYKLMYQKLVDLGFYTLGTMQRYYKDNQVEAYSATIYNADTEYKYMATVTEGTSTTDQRYKAHGSAVEDLDWWMKGRLYFVGGQYFTINDKASEYAQSSITLNLSPSTTYGNMSMHITSYERNYVNILQGTRLLNNGYMDAYRDGGSADISLGNLVTTASDYRLIIYGHKQIRSLGNLAPLKITNIESTGVVNFTDLLVGSEASGYTNNVFSGFGSAVYAACEEVNTANCKAYEEGDLTNFPLVKTINFKGCDNMTSFRLPSSTSPEVLHLPSKLRSLTINNKPNLEVVTIEGVDMINSIDIQNNNGNSVVTEFALNALASIYGY